MVIELTQPTCYVIAGPNGAGKTTFAMKYLPAVADCHNFINADMIAGGLSPLDPDRVQFVAGKLFLKEIHKQIAGRNDFAFETTLSGRSYLHLIKNLHKAGWQVILFYLWIPSALFSIERVKERVQQGGHNIPEDVIMRRYPKSIRNLIEHYTPLCDCTYCYDNSQPEPHLIFIHEKNKQQIMDAARYQHILRCIDGN